jgi:hypothetical protein
MKAGTRRNHPKIRRVPFPPRNVKGTIRIVGPFWTNRRQEESELPDFSSYERRIVLMAVYL